VLDAEQLKALAAQYERLAHAFEVDIERRDTDCGYIDYVVYGPDGDLCTVSEGATKRAGEKAKLLVAVLNAAPQLLQAALDARLSTEPPTAWPEPPETRTGPCICGGLVGEQWTLIQQRWHLSAVTCARCGLMYHRVPDAQVWSGR